MLGKTDDPLASLRLFRGKGCPQCSGTGFRGRLGVFELFEIDDRARGMIMERRDAAAIRAAAIARGMKTMFQDGLAKVFLGETTLEEVARVAL
jgi:type II secretory ATPase GspE/PulE/Tfp pilus assembly ATPase PilB-like protein